MSASNETREQLERENEELKSRIEVLERETRLDKEATFRALAENANDGIFLTIGQGVQAYANKRAAEITGYSVAELLGTSIKDLVHPDELGKIMERYTKRLAGERVPPQYETIIINKEGKHVPIELTAAKTVWQGQPAGLVIVRDVTDRKQAETVLRESEGRYRRLYDAIGDAVLVHEILPGGRAGRFLEVNDIACQRYGYSRKELLAMTPLNLTAPESLANLQLVRDHYLQGMPVTFEVVQITREGERIPAEIRARPFLLKEQPAVLALVRDIAERKQAEEERQKLQAQFFQAQKMESIGALAGGVAHDFNNLLAAIMAGLSLMELDCSNGDGWNEQLSEMKAMAQRGADLTKQLLGFARLGKYDAKPLNLNDVVTKISKMFGRTRKDITIHLTCASDLLPLLADRTQIEQVLLNLLVNAGQVMHDGGDVVLRTENVELLAADGTLNGTKPGRYVKLSVEDTGVGMDAKTRERIFEPFFATKEIGRGTGLGLASVYGIVKNHGGFITVESEQGKGSTFNVFLPATDQHIVEDRESAAADTIAPQRRGETILVVDDEGQIIRSISRLLAALGYEVLTASNGLEAVEVFRQNHERVSLVILDMIMPGMSGSQTFDALRAIAPAVRVLLSSGYSIEGQATKILERGCNGFIQKPFGLAELLAKLKEIL